MVFNSMLHDAVSLYKYYNITFIEMQTFVRENINFYNDF